MTTGIRNNKKFRNRFQWPVSSLGVWLVLAIFFYTGIAHAQVSPAYIGVPPLTTVTVVPPGTPGPINGGGPGILPNVPINNPNHRLTQGDTQAETTIAAYSNIVVAGWMDCAYYTNPALRNGLTAWGFSTDGGQTWTDSLDLVPPAPLPLANLGDGGTRGDPSLDVDSSGNFYFANLYKMQNGALNVSVHKGHYDGVKVVFAAPTFATNFTDSRSADKEHIGVDKSTGYIYVSYTNFGTAGTNGQIEVVRSTDGGDH